MKAICGYSFFVFFDYVNAAEILLTVQFIRRERILLFYDVKKRNFRNYDIPMTSTVGVHTEKYKIMTAWL
jgi:hypothetical protein